MPGTISSQLEKQEFFFIAFVCHHYSIQMMFSKPKNRLQSNVSILEPELLVSCIFALCYLYFFLFLMSCHYFKTILIKPQCLCKTKILEKGQRALPFAGSVPEILQHSLQILITLQLSALKQCLFIYNENVFSCVSQ